MSVDMYKQQNLHQFKTYTITHEHKNSLDSEAYKHTKQHYKCS